MKKFGSDWVQLVAHAWLFSKRLSRLHIITSLQTLRSKVMLHTDFDQKLPVGLEQCSSEPRYGTTRSTCARYVPQELTLVGRMKLRAQFEPSASSAEVAAFMWLAF